MKKYYQNKNKHRRNMIKLKSKSFYMKKYNKDITMMYLSLLFNKRKRDSNKFEILAVDLVLKI